MTKYREYQEKILNMPSMRFHNNISLTVQSQLTINSGLHNYSQITFNKKTFDALYLFIFCLFLLNYCFKYNNLCWILAKYGCAHFLEAEHFKLIILEIINVDI